jgi:hypothetical protein
MSLDLSPGSVDPTALLRLRHRNAALAFEFALQRWGRAIERAGYNSDQPRAPAGGPDGGQWTSGGGSGDVPVSIADNGLASGDFSATLSDAPPNWAEAARTGVEPNLGNFSPDKPGYHDYTVGPTLVCTSKIQCTPQEMVDWLSRYAYPGADYEACSAATKWQLDYDYSWNRQQRKCCSRGRQSVAGSTDFPAA